MKTTKDSWENVKTRLLFPFEKALIDSFENHSSLIHVWMRPSVWLQCLAQCVGNVYPIEERNQCLTYVKLYEWQRTILWIDLAAYSGAYESIGRELRFLLEDVLQAIAIDRYFPEMNLERKISMISQGFRSRTRYTNMTETMEMRFRNIYRTLSEYIHPSQEIVRSSMRGKAIFKPDDSQFNDLLKIFTETTDLLLSVLLGYFSDAIDEFIEYSSEWVVPIKLELYNYGYWKTLEICSEACPMAFKEPPFEYYNDVED